MLEKSLPEQAPKSASLLDRLSTKEILRVSEALLRCILNAKSVGLILCEKDGTIVEANDAFLNMLQFTQAEMKARQLRWQELTPQEFHAEDEAIIKALDVHGTYPPYEKQYYRKDKTRLSVLLMASRFKDAEPYTDLCLLIDITARKRAEEALAETNRTLDQRVRERSGEVQTANAFLDSLIENIPNMIFVKDAKRLHYVRFNKAGEELLGYSRAELIGKNDYDFFPKEQADFFTALDREVLSGRKVIDIPEEPVSTREKGVRILHTKKIPLYDETGIPQYLLGISEDITEKKQAEAERLKLIKEQAAHEEMEKAAERLRIVSRASALLGATLDYEATMKNLVGALVPAFADWCSVNLLSPQGDIQTVAYDYIYMKDDPWHLKGQPSLIDNSDIGPQRVVQTGKSVMFSDVDLATIRRFTSDAKRLTILENIGILSYICVPMNIRSKTVGTVSLITTKDSKRRYDENDLGLAEELAGRAVLALDNARLYQTSQNLNRMKDEFLALLSHELRTPLSVIQGFADILKTEGPALSPQELQEYSDAIYRNSENQTRIVSDLLDVSAIMAGKLSCAPQIIKPGAAVYDIIRNFKSITDKKGIALLYDLETAPASIMADPTRFNQIIWNLVSNAIKFTPRDGSVTIIVAEKEGACIIEVIDTGIGIDADFIPHLFERFSQQDSSMTRRFGGLGLGLSITAHLVKLHGGTIKAESAGRGCGAKFTITLPLNVSEA